MAVTAAVMKSAARTLPPTDRPGAPSEFGVTILVGGGSDLSLDRELRLVRSALLYADKVTLCSPRVSMLASVAALPNLGPAASLDMMLDIAPHLVVDDQTKLAMAQLGTLRQKRFRTRAELLQLRQVEQMLTKEWAPMFAPTVEKMIEEAGGSELSAALEAGVLRVDSLEGGLQNPESMVELFIDRLRSVTSDSSTYAMFDEMASGIVTAGTAEGFFTIASTTEAKMGEARMGAEIVARLPAFPAANMQDILEVRDLLKNELIRFRRAVARLRELTQTSPLNPDFADEADRIYRDEVEPALTEISQILSEGSALTTALLAGGAIATVAAVLFALPALPHLLVELLAGGAGAGVLGKAREDWERRNQRARGNDLFFLYEVGRHMEVRRSITLF